MLALTPRMLVYYKGAPTQVTVVAINADRTRTPLATPKAFQGTQPGLNWTERLIREFCAGEAAGLITPPDGHLEWSLRYKIPFPASQETRIIITDTASGN